MISKESCLKYSGWKEGDNDCLVLKGIEYCCLGLRGDSSSMTFLNDHFNTTQDLVNLLSSGRLDFIIKRDTRDPAFNRSIKIAVNFQNVDPSTSMSKKFLYDLVSVLEDRNLDIVMFSGIIGFYDGSCDQTRGMKSWRGYQVSQCDEQMEKVYKFPNFFTQSASFVAGGARTKNFNAEFQDIQFYCDSGLPAYGVDFPYLFYECAHEIDVKFIVSVYSSPTCKRATSDPPLESLRITSNVDQELLEVFIAENNNFGLGLSKISNPRVEYLKNFNVVLFGYTDSENTTHLETRSFDPQDFLNLKESKTYPNQVLVGLKIDNNTVLLTLCQSSDPSNCTSEYFTYAGSATLVSIENVLQVEGAKYLSSALIENGPVFSLNQLNDNTVQLQVDSNFTWNITYQGQVQSADISVYKSSASEISGLIITEVLVNRNNKNKSKLFGSHFVLNLEIMQLNLVTSDTYLDFGSQPFVKITQGDDGEFYVLEMHSNGMCQCGTGINNGNINKCLVATTERDHVDHLQNVKYSLIYNWGRVSSFIDRIQNNQTIFGSCDKQIMHGKFSNGEYPNGFVFRNQTSGELKTFFVNQNADYADLPFVTKLFCGGTIPNYGKDETSYRMQSFRVIDYPTFVHLV
eukprot:CAMPEP_0176420258 /NCGR_PEP_ID=MMETSP0127-20121128/8508_1 /TAXON_ID=938130 /ORGANISM="Platyophrya macrostoma, Strain WH" /LENGTH=628 /DNA_ID=CAMNT_0017800837 /DNA_START=83 /DNA_END=1969 /DNA_ORIENTATION=+